jgi:hypothetical protein
MIEVVGKFIGKWIVLPAIICLILWTMAENIWGAAGVWAIIIPIAIAAAVFYFWQRSTKRAAHPWE